MGKIKNIYNGVFRISGSNKEMAEDLPSTTDTVTPSVKHDWLLQLLMDVKYDRENPHAAKQLIEKWHELEKPSRTLKARRKL